MAASSSSSSSSCEHEDVLIEILSRLPVKSLVRFKCVHKSWYDLIKNPYFIKKHLERNRTNENDATLAFVTVYKTPESALWISSRNNTSRSSNDEEAAATLNPVSLPFYADGIEYTPHIVGHVNGIYCTNEARSSDEVHNMSSLFLWNPALREVRKIPPPPPPMSTTNEHDPFRSTEYGFGYDSRNNDFKVVVIRRPEDGLPTPDQAFLYTLSTDSWKEIVDSSENIPDMRSTQYSVFVGHGNGVVYWASSNWSKFSAKTVLSFDLGTELFRELAMPDEIEDHEDAYIADFKDSLVAIRMPEPDKVRKEYYYEFWVMKGYYVDDDDDDVNNNNNVKVMSWTKLYNIGPLFKVKRPLRFWNNGEILFEKRANRLRPLLSYNPRTQQIKDLHIDTPLQIVTYMETLVSISIDGGNKTYS